MLSSDFERYALSMISNNFSPLPIIPGSKTPGTRSFSGVWQPMHGWQRWCVKQPSLHTVASWLRMIREGDVGLGVACGMGLICIDIDLDSAMDTLLAMLPPSRVQKKGKKGISLFYRGNTDHIRSRNFRTPKVGLVDLLSEGKQTVLPPSIHPDTGEPYYWRTDGTLMDLRLHQLTGLPDDIADRIGEVLKDFGYDPSFERPARGRRETPTHTAVPSPTTFSVFRETNKCALADLDRWVPKLHLYKCRPKPGGYEAVATWRASCTGQYLERRKRNLSIVSAGIRDFGEQRPYSPVDLVMAALELDKISALNWLLGQLPQEPLITFRKQSPWRR